MPNWNGKTSPQREKRIGAIAAYSGSVSALWREAESTGLVQRVRTFAQDTASDLQRALVLLSSMQGVAIVVHGPAGCGAVLPVTDETCAWMMVTGVDERDSILGADKKLSAAIVRVHAERAPALIAVLATPIIAINNDDIDSVAEELQGRLQIPIIVVRTSGFASKIGETGHDAVVHALAKELRGQYESNRGAHVNLVSVAESAEDVACLRSLLAEIGVEAWPFPQFAEGARLHRARAARCSVSVDPDESEYAGAMLQDLFEIDYVSPETPLGGAATRAWLQAVGAAVGREREAACVADRHGAEVEAASKRLSAHCGARVHVNLPAGKGFAMANLLGELGLTIAAIQIRNASAKDTPRLAALAREKPELPILVGQNQAFEEVNLLSKLKPDLYIGSGNAAVHALRLGIPVLDLQNVPILGYAGLGHVVDATARRLANPALARFLGDAGDSVYAKTWLAKSTHWFIKHEVK